MNSVTLTQLVNKDPVINEICLGVFAANKIPKYLGGKRCLIANTHGSSMQGEHWVAMYRDGLEAAYFDSFGLKPKNCAIKFIGSFCYFNNICLQETDSVVCGYYCLYYLHYKCLGYCLRDIVSYLKAQPQGSDAVVKDFVEQTLI